MPPVGSAPRTAAMALCCLSCTQALPTTHLEPEVDREAAAGVCERVPAAAGLALKERHLGAIPVVREARMQRLS